MKARNAVLIGVALAVVLLGWAVALLVLTPSAQQALRSLPSFTEHAAGVLSARYPDRKFSVVDDGAAIQSGGTRFQLQELYAELESSHAKPEQIDDRIRAHFAAAFARVEAQHRPGVPVKPPATPSWEQAKKVLMPLLVSSQYAQRIPTLVRRNLLPGVELAYTIGQQQGTVFLVASDDAAAWKMDEPHVYAQALDNLAAASPGLKLEAGPDSAPNLKEKWLGVMVRDGFDGARILLPDVRRQMAAILGEPFYFSIPERGFLVAWSRDYPKDRQFRQQGREQFAKTPAGMAVSPDVFIGTAAGFRAGG